MGLYFYHITRSKKLANFLSDLHISINYQKTTEIKTSLNSNLGGGGGGGREWVDFTPTPTPCWFSLNNSEMVKAVTLAFSSL